MPHVALTPNLPGMAALGAYRPDVYARLASLADLLLQQQHPQSTLSPGERELLASYVSSLNHCAYCTISHGCVAAAHLGGDTSLVSAVQDGSYETSGSSAVSPKMKALLHVARLVQKGGKEVSGEAVESAKAAGATDMDVHDTVLIAAMFCMFNRYVDGLATEMPADREMFVGRGRELAKKGYVAMGRGSGGGVELEK
jgi:uncharacterized peroxidase-related enzyme